jgi:hypothetical protein
VEVITNANVRACFHELSIADPNVAKYLPRMVANPVQFLSVRGGYKLEGTLRRALDGKYGQHPTVIAITNLLSALPSKVRDIEERAFLSEAINCYRVQAYRAAIVMTWNLAFDHLLRWIIADPMRLDAFNSTAATKYPKKAIVVAKIEDFEEYKEAETIEICRTAGLMSKNIIEILREKLKRRNIAAHPSQIIVTQPQADDAIADLVNNVVLALS